MNDGDNPFHTGDAEKAVCLTLTQRFIALSIAIIVVVCSWLTMTAFLFGILVAMHGTDVPSPLDWQAQLNGPFRSSVRVGLSTAALVAIGLGTYVLFRILRVQRLLIEARIRRHDLATQLLTLKSSLVESKDQPDAS